ASRTGSDDEKSSGRRHERPSSRYRAGARRSAGATPDAGVTRGRPHDGRRRTSVSRVPAGERRRRAILHVVWGTLQRAGRASEAGMKSHVRTAALAGMLLIGLSHQIAAQSTSAKATADRPTPAEAAVGGSVALPLSS